MHHVIDSHLNSKVDRILARLPWMLKKVFTLVSCSFLFFIFCFALYYGAELRYPRTKSHQHRDYDVEMEWDDAKAAPFQSPTMRLDDDEWQRVMSAPSSYYDASLIWQSLKVAVQVARRGNGPEQILKIEDGQILRLQGIDFIQNPYRILYVQRGIQCLTEIFWRSLVVTLIIFSCSLKKWFSS